MATPDYFARITGSVNFPLLQTKRVVVVGVGMVGSQIAEELAKCGVGHLRFIDHDRLEKANLSRHVLTDDYLGWNKAEAMTVYLAKHIEGIHTEALPRKIINSAPDATLDQWLDSDLIVAATDDRDAQRRIGRRALALGVPSVFPSLYVEGGGEVIVQLDDQLPCFSCWDEFRPSGAPLRGAQALNIIALPVLYITLRICLALLDPSSPDREVMRAGRGQPPYQAFGLNRFGTLRSGHLTPRPDCSVCHGVGSGLRAAPPLTQARNPLSTNTDNAPAPVDAIGAFFHLLGQVVAWCVSVAIVSAVALVWIWFWSMGFKAMQNPIIWIGLIGGGMALYRTLVEDGL